MSAAGSTTPSTLNTTIESLGIDASELGDMSVEERKNFYESLVEGLSEDEISELEEKIETELGSLHEEIWVLQRQLEGVLNSTEATPEEIARCEYHLNVLDELLPIIDKRAFSKEFDSALELHEAKSIDATDGHDVTFSAPDGIENGDSFVIDTTHTEEKNSTLFADEHAEDPSWIDSDGDGYKDIQADLNGDGTADVDTNKDGRIDEKDMLNFGQSLNLDQTVTLQLKDGDQIDLTSYDPVTNETHFSITTAEGLTYTVVIKGEPSLIFSGNYTLDTTQIADVWPPELLHRVFESETAYATKTSFGEALDIPDPEEISQEYYTKINFVTDTDKRADIFVSAADFTNQRTYQIEMDPNASGQLSLTFPPDVTVEYFRHSLYGYLIIRATNAKGEEILFTPNGFKSPPSSSTPDTLIVNGSVISTESLPVYEASQEEIEELPEEAGEVEDTEPEPAEEESPLAREAEAVMITNPDFIEEQRQIIFDLLSGEEEDDDDALEGNPLL